MKGAENKEKKYGIMLILTHLMNQFI